MYIPKLLTDEDGGIEGDADGDIEGDAIHNILEEL